MSAGHEALICRWMPDEAKDDYARGWPYHLEALAFSSPYALRLTCNVELLKIVVTKHSICGHLENLVNQTLDNSCPILFHL